MIEKNGIYTELSETKYVLFSQGFQRYFCMIHHVKGTTSFKFWCVTHLSAQIVQKTLIFPNRVDVVHLLEHLFCVGKKHVEEALNLDIVKADTWIWWFEKSKLMHILLVIHFINDLAFLQDHELANEGYPIFAKKVKVLFWRHTVFSVTRRSRSDESHSLTEWVGVSIDFTDVTLVSDDTYRRLYWCDPDDPDESYLVMKVI